MPQPLHAAQNTAGHPLFEAAPSLPSAARLGLLLALVGLACWGLQLPLGVIFNPLPWGVVLGGSLLALGLSTSWNDTKRCIALLFAPNGLNASHHSVDGILDDTLALAEFSRKNGLLALNDQLPALEGSHPFLYQACTLLTENPSTAQLKESLSLAMEVHFRNQHEGIKHVELLAGYAPTLGLMGALLGLMKCLVVLSPEAGGSLASSDLAAAFASTLLGLGMANLWLLPLAQGLRKQASRHWLQEALILQACLGIHRGEHPLRLEESLLRFLHGGIAPSRTETPTADKSPKDIGISQPQRRNTAEAASQESPFISSLQR